ncbi:hypothetical protein GCM10009716_11930 [Streptomyces sodiiphilus]|uniref:DUF1449 family protein n=1 Tax=Streptomyces sodiiphilus TaxID=226217 RepID=A0ABN2NUJ9_9ACTN
MGDFVSTTLEFPVVVFTFPLLIVVAYWIFAAVSGAAGEATESDSADTGSAPAGFAGFLAVLGLGGVPVTVVLSLVIAIAWFVSLVGTALFDSALIRLGWLALALVAAWHATWLLARPLRRLLRTGRTARNADFVGLVCVVRTGRVGPDFGVGEVTAADGTTALIEIRDESDSGLHSGGRALIFDYDPESDVFRVAPAGSALDPLG